MRVIDLSHPIREDMPVYPGTEPPRLRQGNTIDRDGFAEKELCLYSHTGTHIDAPAHLLPGAPCLGDLPVGHFVGSGVVIPFRRDRAGLLPFEARLREARWALLHTGWSARWGSEAYFSGFPVLSPDAARWLASLGLAGIGVDAISVDPVGDALLPIHRILLGAGLCIVENLRNLEAIGDDPFLFSCLPLSLPDADGSPVRAVAMFANLGGK